MLFFKYSPDERLNKH